MTRPSSSARRVLRLVAVAEGPAFSSTAEFGVLAGAQRLELLDLLLDVSSGPVRSAELLELAFEPLQRCVDLATAASVWLPVMPAANALATRRRDSDPGPSP